MPLTGEGPTEISAFDETGNVATASFYTEFGFDTLQRSLEQINSQLGLDATAARRRQLAAASPIPADGTPVAVSDSKRSTPGDVSGGRADPTEPSGPRRCHSGHDRLAAFGTLRTSAFDLEWRYLR